MDIKKSILVFLIIFGWHDQPRWRRWWCSWSIWSWICAHINCELSLSWDTAVIECCPLALVVANDTNVWQQCNFIWCSPALLHLQSLCTCPLSHLCFISADKFSEAHMTVTAAFITEVISAALKRAGQSFKASLPRLFLLLQCLSKILKKRENWKRCCGWLRPQRPPSKDEEMKNQDSEKWTALSGVGFYLVALCPPPHLDTQYCWIKRSKVSLRPELMISFIIYESLYYFSECNNVRK